MTVIIGVDPHKQSHTAVAISGDEREMSFPRCGGQGWLVADHAA